MSCWAKYAYLNFKCPPCSPFLIQCWFDYLLRQFQKETYGNNNTNAEYLYQSQDKLHRMFTVIDNWLEVPWFKTTNILAPESPESLGLVHETLTYSGQVIRNVPVTHITNQGDLSAEHSVLRMLPANPLCHSSCWMVAEYGRGSQLQLVRAFKCWVNKLLARFLLRCDTIDVGPQ